jgi:hypothetical protein
MKHLQTNFHENLYRKVLLKFVDRGLFPFWLQPNNKTDIGHEDLITRVSARRSGWLGNLKAAIVTMVTLAAMVAMANSVKKGKINAPDFCAVRRFSNLNMPVF